MSIFKLKIIGDKSDRPKDLYVGTDVLNCPAGIILEVSSDSVSNYGDVIIRTTSSISPLYTLFPKNLHPHWGLSLEGYTFLTLHGKKESDYIT